MIRTALALLAAAALAAPAHAQDARQRAAVEAGQSCPRCNAFQSDLSYKEFPGRNYVGARLRQSDMTLLTADRSNFSGADMQFVNLYGARLVGANLSGADLSNAVLVGGYFGSANFARAKLAGANLSGADLAGARGLTQGQLNQACGDQATRLPGGLRIPMCGPA